VRRLAEALKNGLPLFLGYVITNPELNEVQFCLCMASSVKKSVKKNE
jgi:hypothetical protein